VWTTASAWPVACLRARREGSASGREGRRRRRRSGALLPRKTAPSCCCCCCWRGKASALAVVVVVVVALIVAGARRAGSGPARRSILGGSGREELEVEVETKGVGRRVKPLKKLAPFFLRLEGEVRFFGEERVGVSVSCSAAESTRRKTRRGKRRKGQRALFIDLASLRKKARDRTFRFFFPA
jgi:hypothetical protein